MRKLGSILLAVAFLAALSLAEDTTTIAGYITDAKCAPKVGGDCAKKCIEKGEKAVFVTDSDKKVLKIDNQDAVTAHAGHHVSVTGTVKGDTLHVDKVAMVEEPAAK
ncbi:MAG TPA: hypothetical protein VKE93_09825 [Candidatus Angelobacter sp.]|nr:hypothetical protein [Candidatus Angelobacter sp.]